MAQQITKNLMEHQPKVSVIMPTYNRAHFLGEAIQSALAQTFNNFELIVVDDGSTDDTPELVKQLSEPRVRYLRHEQNRGISAAMNTGIRASYGTYIARLDSDDIWLPEMLATQVSILNADSDTGAVYAKGQVMDEQGNLLSEIWGIPQYDEHDSFKSLLLGDCICNITVVVRRSCIERAGWYDEALRVNEDWDFWLRVARHSRFAFVNRVLARLRRHPGNITADNALFWDEHLEGRACILDRIFSLPALPSTAKAIQPLAYFNHYMRAGLLRMRTGTYRRGFECLWKAIFQSGRHPVAACVNMTAWLCSEWLSFYGWGQRFVIIIRTLRRRWE